MIQHAPKCPKYYPSGSQECKCDGYHTFDELYEHRISLFIALCYMLNEFDFYYGVSKKSDLCVWRSKLHADDKMYEDWFIMGIGQHKGSQITYHLPISYWNRTNFADTLKRAPRFDGHTSDDVLERLNRIYGIWKTEIK